MNSDRDQCVMTAKYAEQTKHYAWMVQYMEKAVYASEEKLTVEERNLLYTAFSKYTDFHREALRTYASHLPGNLDAMATIRSLIEDEMVGICRRVVNLVDTLLQRPMETVASKVFCLKMKGDYLRYLAEANLELSPGTDAAEAAREAYEQAQAFDTELAALRLGHLSIHMMPLHGEEFYKDSVCHDAVAT